MANWITGLFKKRQPRMLSNGMVLMPTGMLLWGGNQYSPEYLLGLNVDQLQRKALQIWWDSVHARGAINQLNTLTTNTGLRVQSTPARAVLGLEIGDTQAVAAQIEGYFDLVRQQKRCSHDGRHTFNELEIIGRRCWDVFGEVFCILRYDRLGVNMQLVNPLAVKSPPSISGVTVDRGIRFSNGRPVGFYVETIEQGHQEYKYIPFVGAGGKRQGIHCADIQTPEQVRGLSRLAPSFHEFKRILQALKLELDTMTTHATVAMVITRDKPVMDENRLGKAFGAVSTTNAAPTSTDQIDSDRITTNTGGMVIQDFKPGEKIDTLDTNRPNVNIPVFIDKQMEWIGPAIGLPATIWKMLLNSNYMASRGEMEMAWKSFAVEVYRFSTSFEQEFYNAVVAHMVGTGRIVLLGWSDPEAKEAWLSAVWRGTPMPRLNPLQEEKATTERIKNFTSTRESESQKSTGTSFENNMERQLYEMRHMKALKQLYDENGLEFDAEGMGF